MESLEVKHIKHFKMSDVDRKASEFRGIPADEFEDVLNTLLNNNEIIMIEKDGEVYVKPTKRFRQMAYIRKVPIVGNYVVHFIRFIMNRKRKEN